MVGDVIQDLDEEKRLSALSDYDIMDTPEEEEFNNLAALAAQICEVPFAQINFLDETRSWSKAVYGMDVVESAREDTFCHFTIQEESHLVVPDASKDPRFKEFPFVKDAPNVRFYAGYNIKGEQNLNLGSICVIGQEPRSLTEIQHNALRTLAKEVEVRLELRKAKMEQETIMNFLESSVDMMMIVEPCTKRIHRYSKKVANFFKLEGEITDLYLNDIFPDESFIKSVTTWNTEGAHGKLKPLANVLDVNGMECFFEVTVTKKHSKWFMVARNVTDEMSYKNRLEKILYEKGVLLSEVHHRVKNNLAVISSILQLEELKSESKEVQQALYQNYMRIKSMSLIHDEMYKQNDFTGVQFDVYLANFAETLKNDKRAQNIEIDVEISLEEVMLNLNQAVPCALIVNELVSNAFDFAFQGRDSGLIKIGLEQKGCTVLLTVQDNGVGLPEGFDLASSPTLANTLVYSYSEQLDSTVEVVSEEGSTFKISFKKNDFASGSSANQYFSMVG